ncbi:MAG: hypothetical protein ACK5QX_03690 [bacterium]
MSNNIFGNIFGGQVRGTQTKRASEPKVEEDDVIEVSYKELDDEGINFKPFIQTQTSQNNTDANSEGFFSSRNPNNFYFSEKAAFSQTIFSNVTQDLSVRNGGENPFSSFKNSKSAPVGKQLAYAA